MATSHSVDLNGLRKLLRRHMRVNRITMRALAARTLTGGGNPIDEDNATRVLNDDSERGAKTIMALCRASGIQVERVYRVQMPHVPKSVVMDRLDIR
jgi:hypothetical protein